MRAGGAGGGGGAKVGGRGEGVRRGEAGGQWAGWAGWAGGGRGGVRACTGAPKTLHFEAKG